MLTIQRLQPLDIQKHLAELAGVLHDCVEGGASVNFLWPYSQAEAAAFFASIAAEVSLGRRILLAAFLDTQLVGTIQIVTGMPPNQAHRAELAKLLVHRSARGQGVGRALMDKAEQLCRENGKTLLVLDTVPGTPAYHLYTHMGWTECGIIPGYATFPDGRLCDTAIFWKRLP